VALYQEGELSDSQNHHLGSSCHARSYRRGGRAEGEEMKFTLEISLGTTLNTEVDPLPQDVAHVLFLTAAQIQAFGWNGKSSASVTSASGHTVGWWTVQP